MKLRIALLQMDCSELDVAANRECVRAAVRTARANGAQALALPELWASGYALEAACHRGAWEQDFALVRELSRDGFALLGGSLLERDAAGRHSNCALASVDGIERMRFRKLHLFGPLAEVRYLTRGPALPEIFDFVGVRTAMAICYDLRFAEVFRQLALGGVELIHVPAQWPKPRIHHWRVLLQARAIECQAYLLGVNRVGHFGDIEFPGGSLLVGPWGDIVVDAGDKAGIYYGDIETDKVAEARARLPFLNDRRRDLFAN
ncbi:MAG: nitrilase-related carbon-nitrogen hydrolase [Planctomycetota bacterium]